MLTCSRCKADKDNDEFTTRGSRPGIFPYCRGCKRTTSQGYNRALKLETFAQYGGAKCNCCGEEEILFLSLDHLKNDGGQQRRDLKVSGGLNFYRWLKKNQWPMKDQLQVSCHNCNQGRAMNGGICPHRNK